MPFLIVFEFTLHAFAGATASLKFLSEMLTFAAEEQVFMVDYPDDYHDYPLELFG